MASTAQHLAVALRTNANIFHYEGNDLKEFLLGAIACDAPKLKPKTAENKDNKVEIKEVSELEKFTSQMRKAGRNHSHFLPGSIIKENQSKFISPEITMEYGYQPVDDRPESKVDYNQFSPMIDYFYSKYESKMEEPFMKGYLTHLLTDKVYFTEVVPAIVNENKSEIKDYINEKYNKFGYKKKDYLTNAEYLDWSHDALYGVFDDYNYLSLFETKDVFPDLSDLANYLETWEKTDRSFKPSMVEDLNGLEAISSFLRKQPASSLISDAKNQLEKDNIINRKNLSFNGMWSYKLYLDFGETVEEETKNYINLNNKKAK